MINLIPPQIKKKVYVEYFIRASSVFLFAISAWLLTLALLFTAIQVLVQFRIQGLETDITKASGYAESIEEATTKLNRANAKITHLTQEAVEDNFLRYKNTLDEVSADTIDIRSYNIERGEDKLVESIQITAVAEARQDIITFLDLVESHEQFSGVDVPISDLAQARNINFSVTIPIAVNE